MPTASSTEPRSISSSTTRGMPPTIARTADSSGALALAPPPALHGSKRAHRTAGTKTMRSVPMKRPASGKSGRHLYAVPDDAQPALWDTRELERLARLRQLAVETGAPDDAIRLIDQAATADEAISMLTDAGFMPTEAESDEGLLSWFAPLLEPGCEPLEAELCGTEFIGELRRSAPPNLDVADVLRDVIERFAAHRTPEALAMMIVLSAVAPARLRIMAADAAARMRQDGLADMPWAANIGFPL